MNQAENVLEIYDREILIRHDFETELATYLNHLIKNDFEKLVQILYRIDVDEKILRTLLDKQAQTDAGKIMATLIIERQLKKIETREQFRQMGGDW